MGTATGLDYAVIIIYFALVLGVGVYLKRFTTTGEDFFLAGRRNSSWVAGLAFLAANMGALELLGMAGNTYKYGAMVAHFYWLGAIPAMLFLAIFMMPFYYSSKIHSVPGYLKMRFDERNRTLNAISFAVMTLLVSGINLYAMALVLHTIVGWNFHVCIWISMFTVMIYVTLGGLTSAIFNEIIQFFLIWGGLALLPILGIIDVGGWDAMMARVPETMRHVWANTGDSSSNPMIINYAGIILGLGFVLSFGYWTTDFLVVQRAFSAKNLRSAIATPIVASFPKMAIPFIVIVTGLVAFPLLPELGPANDPAFAHNYDEVLPLLIERYFPPGLMGLGITALMAGFMSGQAGNISAFNTVWTYDLYRAHINKDATDKHYLFVGRLSTIIGMLISVATAYWAMSMSTIMDWMQAIFTWVNAPLFATILLGMFWRRCTSAGAFWGLLIGMVSSFTMWFLIHYDFLSPAVIAFDANASDMAGNFWRAWWAWLVTFGLTIIISLWTKPKENAELEGLVYGLTPKLSLEGISLWQRPTTWAVISVSILLFLNIYFW
jgi:solute:Na+ symporter, SSS family